MKSKSATAPTQRVQKRSLAVSLVLIGAGCTGLEEQHLTQRDVYADRGACVADWGEEHLCEPFIEEGPTSGANAATTTWSSSSSSSGARTIRYRGPGYGYNNRPSTWNGRTVGGNRSIGRATTGGRSVGSSSTSRGGFGSSGHASASS